MTWGVHVAPIPYKIPNTTPFGLSTYMNIKEKDSFQILDLVAVKSSDSKSPKLLETKFIKQKFESVNFRIFPLPPLI